MSPKEQAAEDALFDIKNMLLYLTTQSDNIYPLQDLVNDKCKWFDDFLEYTSKHALFRPLYECKMLTKVNKLFYELHSPRLKGIAKKIIIDILDKFNIDRNAIDGIDDNIDAVAECFIIIIECFE